MSAADGFEYDVFISYASEQRAWVTAQLYEPLKACRTRAGADAPAIFIDYVEIRPGQDWMLRFPEALSRSRKVVLVFSRDYLTKSMCQHEMSLAVSLHLRGARGTVIPLLQDAAMEGSLPPVVSNLHYLTPDGPDWLGRLCDLLELVPPPRRLALEFLDQPPIEIGSGTTLSPLRVALRTGDRTAPPRAESITLALDRGALSGRTEVRTVEGVATFDDVRADEPAGAARLVAEADGYERAVSRPFAVLARAADVLERGPDAGPPADSAAAGARAGAAAPAPTVAERPVHLPGGGEVVFFDRGPSVAVLEADRASVYAWTPGEAPELLGWVPLAAPLRLWRRAGTVVALADWSGAVHILEADGRCRSLAAGGPDSANGAVGGFCVPGDVSVTGGRVYVGFWSGAVFVVEPDGAELVRLFTHAPGVRVLAAAPALGGGGAGDAGDVLVVGGLDGRVRVYRGGKPAESPQLGGSPAAPQALHLAKAYPGCVVLVGDREVYQVLLNRPTVYSDDLPLGGVTAAFGECDKPVLVDATGRGCRCGVDLFPAPLRAQPGAVPVSADHAGRYGVFLNPDGSRTLMVDGRTVLGHRGGTFAVSPAGDAFALGGPDGLRLFTPAALQDRLP